ncbi:putative glutamine-dependent NAD(+) synthetase [Endomicrobiia bacterium]|nr:putative glutamine-dependent NAD(+) synthetase [Endomicrobiia bacterium]
MEKNLLVKLTKLLLLWLRDCRILESYKRIKLQSKDGENKLVVEFVKNGVTHTMKIALAQMRVKQGNPRENYQNLVSFAKKAKNLGADLIAFPEMCIPGYLMSDRWTEDEFIDELLSYNDKISGLAKETSIIIVYGNIDLGDGKNEDGKVRKYNAVYVAQSGNIIVRRKSLLPNYRMFDDKRYFSSDVLESYELSTCNVVTLSNEMKIGLEICEDLWSSDYKINPTQELIKHGAEFIINISASPFSVGKSIARDNRIKELKNLVGDKFVPFYYVNCVGTQNNGKAIVTFDGDSRVYSRTGERQWATFIDNLDQSVFDRLKLDGGIKPKDFEPLEIAPYQEGLVVINKDSYYTHIAKNFPSRNNNRKNLSQVEQKFLAVQEAYKSMDEMLGSPKYVFGLSGGIDSALNMVLCSLAVGKSKILAYNLPTFYNSDKTKQAASKLCDGLSIKLKFIAINDILEEFNKTLTQGSNLKSITEENLQARIRTIILMAQTSENNAVLINNTNKVELALGYGTLYGDLAGAWCPLGDLTKTEIWEMARYINSSYGQIIPQELIPGKNYKFNIDQILPSAELKENQFDPMIWGFDDWLLEQFMEYKKQTPEKILKTYLKTKHSCMEENNMFDKYGMKNAIKFIEHIEWFFNKLYANVFKRIQAPPVLVLSKSAFGGDYRESQYKYEFSSSYQKLKKEILQSDA